MELRFIFFFSFFVFIFYFQYFYLLPQGASEISKLGVFGVGNTIMRDDGIGVLLLDRLREHELPENVILIEQGVAGMSIIHRLDGFQAAVIIDAVDFRGKAGEGRIFSPGDAEDMNIGRTESLHDCNILEAIKIAKALGQAPEHIRIFGVQPKEIGFGEEISEELAARLDEMEGELLSLVLEMAQRIRGDEGTHE